MPFLEEDFSMNHYQICKHVVHFLYHELTDKFETKHPKFLHSPERVEWPPVNRLRLACLKLFPLYESSIREYTAPAKELWFQEDNGLYGIWRKDAFGEYWKNEEPRPFDGVIGRYLEMLMCTAIYILLRYQRGDDFPCDSLVDRNRWDRVAHAFKHVLNAFDAQRTILELGGMMGLTDGLCDFIKDIHRSDIGPI